MKIKNIFCAAATFGLMAVGSSAHAIPTATFTLSVSSNPTNGNPAVFNGSNFGTVSLSQVSSTEVDFSVTLATGYAFAATGTTPQNAFAFNLVPTFSLSNFVINPTSTGFVAHAPVQESISQTGGFGTFDAGIDFDGTQNGGSNAFAGPLLFKVTRSSGLQFSDFENLNSSSYMFTADLVNTVSRATGNVATGVNKRTPDGDPTPVPEPTTLALLGLGLLGVAAARRRKN